MIELFSSAVTTRKAERILASSSPDRRALLERAVSRLRILCAAFLHRKYPRLTQPPLNLETDELLDGVVAGLLTALQKVRPQTVRQFFALANQHMRWELNDLARRLDEHPPAEAIAESAVGTMIAYGHATLPPHAPAPTTKIPYPFGVQSISGTALDTAYYLPPMPGTQPPSPQAVDDYIRGNQCVAEGRQWAEIYPADISDPINASVLTSGRLLLQSNLPSVTQPLPPAPTLFGP
jgi:hypothetical protein